MAERENEGRLEVLPLHNEHTIPTEIERSFGLALKYTQYSPTSSWSPDDSC